MATHDPGTARAFDGPDEGDASRPWTELASGYEQARAREDSLDRLVEWPAQRDLLGDVTVRALRTARAMLTDEGFVLLTRTQPVRYALERAEENGTTLGEEYFSTSSFSYRHRSWNEGVTLTKRPYTMSDLLSIFSAAGMWVETAVEPQMSREIGERYPHKQAVLDTYLGILMFKLRPLPGRP